MYNLCIAYNFNSLAKIRPLILRKKGRDGKMKYYKWNRHSFHAVLASSLLTRHLRSLLWKNYFRILILRFDSDGCRIQGAVINILIKIFSKYTGWPASRQTYRCVLCSGCIFEWVHGHAHIDVCVTRTCSDIRLAVNKCSIRRTMMRPMISSYKNFNTRIRCSCVIS